MMMEDNSNKSELIQIITKFSESGWTAIDEPSKKWLNNNENTKELIIAIEQSNKECGNCGCKLDPLYKRALQLL